MITGASGLLGTELSKLYPDAYTPTHDEMPIENWSVVKSEIDSYRPMMIIHLAAMTGPNRCRAYKREAWKVNVEGTRNLVTAACMRPYRYFVLMSTPCVFKGDEDFYTEDSIPEPDNFYGLTKLAQEIIVQNSPDDYLVIRANFVKREKYQFDKAFTDRFSRYLYADVLAGEIKRVVDDRMLGTIHLCGDKKMSMFELAKLTRPDVQPLTLEEYYKNAPDSARLTKNMTLETNRSREYIKFK